MKAWSTDKVPTFSILVYL